MIIFLFISRQFSTHKISKPQKKSSKSKIDYIN